MSRCSFAQTSTDDASVACHPAHFLDIVKLLSRSAELARRTTLFHVKHHILLRAVCHPSAMPSTIVRSHMIGTDDRPGSPKPTHTAGLATITYQHPCWCPASVLMVTAPLAAGPQLTSDDYSLEIIYHKHRAIPDLSIPIVSGLTKFLPYRRRCTSPWTPRPANIHVQHALTPPRSLTSTVCYKLRPGPSPRP